MKFSIKLQLLLVLVSCNSNRHDYNYSQGGVFATYFRFQIDSDKDFSKPIDSIFKVIDKAANSYVDSSEISKFNRSGVLANPSPTFLDMLQKAKTYNKLSEGYFEPTLYPLINAWKNKVQLDSAKIDSLLKLVSYDYLDLSNNQVKAIKKGVKIDLSAMGEGYAIDAITSILDRSGVTNYMIEIGGEMKSKGKSSSGRNWRIGIENPETPLSERGTSLMDKIELNNKGISTSGSYRKFYTDRSGNKYSHIIDPKTGCSVNHNLLSVSIIANSSTIADALATACMSMGTEKAKHFIEQNPELEGFLIYSEKDKLKTWSSINFPKKIK